MFKLLSITATSGVLAMALAGAAQAHDNSFHRHHDHHGDFRNSRYNLFDNPAYEDFNDHSGIHISGSFSNPFDYDPEIDDMPEDLRPAQQ